MMHRSGLRSRFNVHHIFSLFSSYRITFSHSLEINYSSFVHVCTEKRRHFSLLPLKSTTNTYMKAVKGWSTLTLGTVQIQESSLLEGLANLDFEQ